MLTKKGNIFEGGDVMTGSDLEVSVF